MRHGDSIRKKCFVIFGLAAAVAFLSGCGLMANHHPPIAILDADPTRGAAPLIVSFDGSHSSDAVGQIVQYHWDFNDGTEGSGPLVSHIFQHDGVYLVTLTVFDNLGAKDDDRTRIVVGNPSPAAIFTTSTASGWLPLAVSFDGSASFDPDGGKITRYDWNFGDGETTSGVRASHVYTNAGRFTAKLIITLMNGNSNTAELSIAVLDFRNARDLRTGRSPTAILANDFDGDGSLDLVTANSESDDLSIFLGEGGEPLFSSAMRVPAGKRPVALASGDFNGDGLPDLAVASFNSGEISLLFNSGNRHFNNEQKITIGRWISGVVATDLDRDGKVDLIATDSGNDKVLVFLGDGAGSFVQQQPVLVGNSPDSLAVADFNDDGRPDLAVTNFFDDTMQILIGDGVGGFEKGAVIRVGQGPTSIKATDFNGDGLMDLIVSNTSAATVSILISSGSGRFTRDQVISAGRGVRSAELVDFDGDGSLDLVTANPGDDTLSIMLNDGFGALDQAHAKNFAEGDGPKALWVADFNHDGFPDIAIVSFYTDRVTILLNQL